jgi:hypothetical protein
MFAAPTVLERPQLGGPYLETTDWEDTQHIDPCFSFLEKVARRALGISQRATVFGRQCRVGRVTKEGGKIQGFI